MTQPKDTRPFNLKLAQQGAKIGIEGSTNIVRLVCSDKGGAHPVVVLSKSEYHKTVAEKIFCFTEQGLRNDRAKLVMLPHGTVQGKAVFVGDKILGAGGGEVVVTSQMKQSDFDKCRWYKEVQYPETRMNWNDFNREYKNVFDVNKHKAGIAASWCSDACKNLANKAIERAIKDGDVIPVDEVLKMLKQITHPHMAEHKIWQYKESLNG